MFSEISKYPPRKLNGFDVPSVGWKFVIYWFYLMVGFSASVRRWCLDAGQFSGVPSKRVSDGLVIVVKWASILCSFIFLVGVVSVVKRFYVSMLARFIAVISIARFSPCSRSCFCVFSVKVANSFFICSVSCSCFWSLFRFGSGEGGLSWSSGLAAGFVSYLFGVQCESFILMSARSSSVSTFPCASVFVWWLLKFVVAWVNNFAVFVKLLLLSILYIDSSIDIFQFVVWYVFRVSFIFSLRYISFLCSFVCFFCYCCLHVCLCCMWCYTLCVICFVLFVFFFVLLFVWFLLLLRLDVCCSSNLWW
jgi:hypothetical protein